jgi:hypothetical protein
MCIFSHAAKSTPTVTVQVRGEHSKNQSHGEAVMCGRYDRRGDKQRIAEWMQTHDTDVLR